MDEMQGAADKMLRRTKRQISKLLGMSFITKPYVG
jgi:hypothetical protein